jgi:hypothetical protein
VGVHDPSPGFFLNGPSHRALLFIEVPNLLSTKGVRLQLCLGLTPQARYYRTMKTHFLLIAAIAMLALSGSSALATTVPVADDAAVSVGALPSPSNGGSIEQTEGIETRALLSVSERRSNTRLGYHALSAKKETGINNTAVGEAALTSNTNGSSNTASGAGTLSANTEGSANVAIGYNALSSNVGGTGNTAIGCSASLSGSIGNYNTTIGLQAEGGNGSYNTAIGMNALASLGDEGAGIGFDNVAIGYNAGGNLTSGSNNIYIGNYLYFGGNSGPTSESNTIRIGYPGLQAQTYIAGVSGAPVAGGTPVYVLSNGQLGVGAVSSSRFKTDIAPMADASNVLLALKPVSFKYKPEYDPKGIPEFGLVAEDVDKVCPALVLRDNNGQISGVRYEQVNAMLLNEFLKEHGRVEEQGKTIADYQKRLATQEERMQALVSRLDAVTQQMQQIAQQLNGKIAKPIVDQINLPAASNRVATSR